jgi:ABC-type glycerol-3-phosphate transport system substrate-binding protein
MRNLQDYYDKTEVIDKENIAASALQRYRFNGKTMGTGDLYCVPKDITPYVMYYNKDLFDKFDLPYPTDIEYWVNDCKEMGTFAYVHLDKEITDEDYEEIAKTSIANGILDPYAALTMWMQFGYLRETVSTDKKGALKLADDHIYGLAKLYPEGLIWSNGADYLSEGRNEVLINTPEFIEAYEFIQACQMEFAAAPTSAVITSTSEKTLFLNGDAACYVEGRSVTVDLRNKADFNWDIAPIPAFTANQNCNGWSGSVGYAVSSKCPYPDEAYLLAEFFTSKDSLEQRFAITDQIPPRKDIDTNKPLSNGIKAQLAYSKPMPTIPQLGTYWSAMGSAYSGIWDGDPVKPALDAAAAAMEAAK